MIAIPDNQVPSPQPSRIKTMLVDDSAVVRGLIGRWLTEDENFELVASCRSALDALDALERLRPDLILLDIEMPELDGLQALPRILRMQPDVSVVVVSSLGNRQADIALRCLETGATDFISKPGRSYELATAADYRLDLLRRLTVLGRNAQRRISLLHPQPAGPAPAAPVQPATPGTATITPFPLAATRPPRPLTDDEPAPPATSRPSRRPGLIVVGASTGGPNAVMAFVNQIKPVIRRLPVIVVQHMPGTFTPIFADHLKRQTGIETHEIRDRELVIPGQVYLAPGGRHLQLSGQGGGIRALLDDGPPVNFCRPSVDVLFHSAATMLGSAVIGVVLTGMGSDGANGAAAIHEAGGTIFVQDEQSSVVWGMPGATYRTGICHGIGTIDELAVMVGQAVGVERAS